MGAVAVRDRLIADQIRADGSGHKLWRLACISGGSWGRQPWRRRSRDTGLVNVREGHGRVGILGPVELAGDGPVRLGGAKERCLLAALAVHCGEAVSDAYLADALWGDGPPRTAAKTLQNYVLRVRHALAEVEGVSTVTQPAGYCLRASPGMIDARLAESLIGEGRRENAGGDPAAAARLFRQALGLWRGPALQEFADRRFAAAEASRLEELREAALEDLFDAELVLGRHHEVVGELEALVTGGPLRERRWGQLMVALYRDGRQAEALDAFHRLRRVLEQDLGVVPSPELRDLHVAILQQSPKLARHSRDPHPAGSGYFGRLPEMSRLLGRFGKAAEERGGVVLLAGEPGIGKSHALRQSSTGRGSGRPLCLPAAVWRARGCPRSARSLRRSPGTASRWIPGGSGPISARPVPHWSV